MTLNDLRATVVSTVECFQPQKMVIQDLGSSLVVPLELAGCMIHFKHRLPTTEEINSLKQYCLTQGDTPWNPSSFFDQVADMIYQHVIDNEQKNRRTV
jgi:hypothetical protein